MRKNKILASKVQERDEEIKRLKECKSPRPKCGHPPPSKKGCFQFRG